MMKTKHFAVTMEWRFLKPAARHSLSIGQKAPQVEGEPAVSRPGDIPNRA